MYEAVYAHPDGESTVARFAHTAADYGFEGIVVRNGADRQPEYDRDRIVDATGIDVVDGVEVRAGDPQEASGSLGSRRGSTTVLSMRGGTNALNRFGVETDHVDVLAAPMAGSGDVNHVLAKAAVEHGVAVEFDVGPILRSSGGRRVRTMQSLGKLREIVDHYDCPYVVSATPRSHLELRAPRDLIAVGQQVGFSNEWIERGLRAWGEVAERNRRVQSETFIEPGVERGRGDRDA